MIWIVNGERSYQAVSVNVAEIKNSEEMAVWIERPSGANIKVFEGSAEDAKLCKEAIDYAVKQGYTTFEVK